MASDLFLSKKLNEDSTLFYYDLNIKTNYPEYILSLSSLIIQEREKGNYIRIRPDKRLRALGLHVLFSNKNSYFEINNSLKEEHKKNFKEWKIKT